MSLVRRRAIVLTNAGISLLDDEEQTSEKFESKYIKFYSKHECATVIFNVVAIVPRPQYVVLHRWMDLGHAQDSWINHVVPVSQ